MPYRKRRVVRRRRPVARKPVDRAQNSRLRKLEKIVNTREIKYQLSAYTSENTNYDGTVYNLIAPNQGVGDNQVIGDRLAVESVEVNYYCGIATNFQTARQNIIRVIIYRDKTGQLGTNVANVLKDSVLGTTNATNAPYFEDQKPNFEVYYDRSHVCSNIQGNAIHRGRFKLRLKKPKLLQLIDNTTGVTKGQWKLLVISDLAGTTNCDITFMSRIGYSDL